MKTIRLGGICADFSCAACCKDTKMMLSQKDIENITSIGYNKKDFVYLDTDGFFKLQNINGLCFFLKDNKCEIYDHRPQGCRFYPIIYDLDLKKAILDGDCPLINNIQDKTVKSFSQELRKFSMKLIEEKEYSEME
ncbi:MAG: YkgJ family cysteine cluster protein [Asgard group archaeon]|nr:YkgJ family cysteine cluster protein [Asgard group archaeon]